MKKPSAGEPMTSQDDADAPSLTSAGRVVASAEIDQVTDGHYDSSMAILRTMTKEKMRSIREGLGLSLTQAAERFNVARRTYVRWEAGDRAIDGPAVIVADMLEEELKAQQSK